MPRTQNDPVCDLFKIPCADEIHNDWPNLPDLIDKNYIFSCNCLPPCTNIKYEVKQSSEYPISEKIKDVAAHGFA
jgi:hypothetical protein